MGRALEQGHEDAVDFVDSVNLFLKYFGMNQDRDRLIARATATAGEIGSRSWYIAQTNAGERLWQAGQPQAAKAIFETVLAGLGETVSYDRCMTLWRLGQCKESMGQGAQAIAHHRQAIADLGQLEPSDGVKRQMGVTQTDLGAVLTAAGQFGAARQAYEASLAIKQEIGGDDRGEATVNFQLGTLEMLEGNLKEATQRYQATLAIFQNLGEPASEAAAWHQLGRAYEEGRSWEQAEDAYRRSADLKEQQGNLAGAAGTWNQLAMVVEGAGKPKEAEAWYRKAIKADREMNNPRDVARDLGNLANLLQTQRSDQLPEARRLAEEALAIQQTLDPDSAEIWKTYSILAKIAQQSGDPATSRAYRKSERQSYAANAGSQHELQKCLNLVQVVVAEVQSIQISPDLEEGLRYGIDNGLGDLVGAIRLVLAGVRNEDELCVDLNYGDALIVGEILQRISAES